MSDAKHEEKHPKWLQALLSEGEVYEVGGSVRDRFLGSELVHQDHDYLVRLIPLDRLQKFLRRWGAVSVVGRSFGVLKFTPYEEPGERRETFDLALPRREQSIGAGHTDFHVDYDPLLPVEQDLLRRDFTINALARNCATGAILDPANGRDDIKSRLLRMVFPDAFTDDPLRILRAVQFVARFNLTIDPATRAVMCEAAHLTTTVSLERVAEEFTKLMTLAPKPSIGFRLLQELGVLRIILPELEETVGVDQPGGYHAYPVFEHSLRALDAVPAELRLRWAALLHDINKPQCKEVDGDKATFYGHEKRGARTARKILKRLRYAHDLADQVSLLVDRHMFTTAVSDKGVRRLIRWLGPDLVYELLQLRRADVIAQGMGGVTDDVDELEARITNEINKKAPFGLKDLAVSGADIMATFGIPPGPRVGEVLSYLLELVLDDPEKNTSVILLDAARKYLHDNA